MYIYEYKFGDRYKSYERYKSDCKLIDKYKSEKHENRAYEKKRKEDDNEGRSLCENCRFKKTCDYVYYTKKFQLVKKGSMVKV